MYFVSVNILKNLEMLILLYLSLYILTILKCLAEKRHSGKIGPREINFFRSVASKWKTGDFILMTQNLLHMSYLIMMLGERDKWANSKVTRV